MKYIKVFFLLLIFNTTYSQCKTESDSIRWGKEVKLKWKDFKGAVPFGYSDIKKATSAFEILATCVDFKEDSIPVFEIEVFFVKTKSWVILKTDDILRHEQGHFDIAEIYARKLRKIYKEINIQKKSNVDEYSNVFEKTQNELDLVQKQYDKEVNFIPENREIWYKKIAKELEELKDYPAPARILSRGK
jgi:hypothetical protein